MTVHLTLLDLLYAAGLVAAVVATSRAIGLQIESKVVIAACRATLQLGVLGYVLLVPLFERGSAALICAYLALVLLIAAREGASRPGYSYGRKMFLHAWVAIAGSGTAVLVYVLLFVLQLTPWYTPQYLIPVAGMVVGNSISAFSLAEDRFLAALKQRGAEVEWRLAMGASRTEAALPLIREATIAGLTPSLNQMSVVGLVSIPGMMTGQILGGQPPGDAARYQLMILFVLMATVLMTIMAGLFLSLLTLIDTRHRLKTHILKKRAGRRLDVAAATCSFVGNILASPARWLTNASRRHEHSGALYTSIPSVAHAAEPSVQNEEKKKESQPIASSTHHFRAISTHFLAISPRTDSSMPRCPVGAAQEERWALSLKKLTVSIALRNEKQSQTKAIQDSSSSSPCKSVSNASVSGQRTLVRDLSLQVRAGEILCVVGRSGIGKSRLLRAIAGLDRNDIAVVEEEGDTSSIFRLNVDDDDRPEGNVALECSRGNHVVEEVLLYPAEQSRLQSSAGNDDSSAAAAVKSVSSVNAATVPWWRNRVRYVPQEIPPLQGSPEEFFIETSTYSARRQRQRHLDRNATSPPTLSHRMDDGKVSSPAESTSPETRGSTAPLSNRMRSDGSDGIDGKLELLRQIGGELGLEHGLLERPWSDLSGGEKQRSAIAIALAHRTPQPPAVLLLDEPSAALDSETTQLLEACVARHCGGGLPREVQITAKGCTESAGSSTDTSCSSSSFGSGGRDTSTRAAALTSPQHPVAVIWVTHDTAQAKRVGTNVLSIL